MTCAYEPRGALRVRVQRKHFERHLPREATVVDQAHLSHAAAAQGAEVLVAVVREGRGRKVRSDGEVVEGGLDPLPLEAARDAGVEVGLLGGRGRSAGQRERVDVRHAQFPSRTNELPSPRASRSTRRFAASRRRLVCRSPRAPLR